MLPFNASLDQSIRRASQNYEVPAQQSRQTSTEPAIAIPETIQQNLLPPILNLPLDILKNHILTTDQLGVSGLLVCKSVCRLFRKVVQPEIQKIPWTPLFRNFCADVSAQGHFSLLQWARKKGVHWNSSVSHNAAKYGHLAMLEWALDNGVPLGSSAYLESARYGHLKILQWLVRTQPELEWKLVKNTVLKIAIENGDLDMIQFAQNHYAK